LIFRLATSDDVGRISAYFADEARKSKALVKKIQEFSFNAQCTFWGIALEFLNLAAHDCLLKGTRPVLVDSNKSKQHQTFRGLCIQSPQSAPVNGRLVCCS
jgi:hypothetical protein